MTQISYVHGLKKRNMPPADELKDRSAGVRGVSDYLPYTEMSKGEFQLALLRDQAKVFAQHYPDMPRHQKAVEMLDNALYRGIHNRPAMVGVIDDTLQTLARQIRRAETQTGPAAGSFIGRTSILHGINADTGNVVKFTEEDCLRYATKEANKFYSVNWPTSKWVTLNKQLNKAKVNRFNSYVATCQTNKDIEQLLNEKLLDAGHHMLYKNLDPSYNEIVGTAVVTKRILHLAGVGGLHNATGIDDAQVSAWVETCILRKNAASSVGTLGSVASSMYLAPGGADAVAKYVQWAQAKTGQTGDEQAARNRMMNGVGIGFAPLLAALIPLISAAIKFASQILEGIQQKRASAMAAANGFGTTAFQAEQNDFAYRNQPTSGDIGSNDMLPLLLLGGGALLLLND